MNYAMASVGWRGDPTSIPSSSIKAVVISVRSSGRTWEGFKMGHSEIEIPVVSRCERKVAVGELLCQCQGILNVSEQGGTVAVA